MTKVATETNPIVVMISGWGGIGHELKISALKSEIEAKGFDTRIFYLKKSGLGDIKAEAQRLVFDLQDDVLNNRPIWLLGYSLGGLVALEATRISENLVDGLITVASPHAGSSLAHLGFFSTSAKQMKPYSMFLLDQLQHDPKVDFFNVACTMDPIVAAASAIHPAHTDLFIARETHISVIFSKTVGKHVSDYLIVKTGRGF